MTKANFATSPTSPLVGEHCTSPLVGEHCTSPLVGEHCTSPLMGEHCTSPLVGEVDALRAAGEGLPESVAHCDAEVSETMANRPPHSKLPRPANYPGSVIP